MKDEIQSAQATTGGEYFRGSTKQMTGIYKMCPIKQTYRLRNSVGRVQAWGRGGTGAALAHVHRGLSDIPALQRDKGCLATHKMSVHKSLPPLMGDQGECKRSV